MSVHISVRIQCEHCPKNFAHKRNLQKHMTVHNGKRFTCDQCPKHYSNNYDLKLHLESHERKTFEKNMYLMLNGKKVNPRYLGRKVRSKNAEHHKANEKDKYYCNQCLECYLSVDDLRQHISERHSKQFSCHHCSREFSVKRRLKKHIQTHMADGKFISSIFISSGASTVESWFTRVTVYVSHCGIYYLVFNWLKTVNHKKVH